MSKKIEIDRDHLYDLYIIQNLTVNEISVILDIPESTLRKRCSAFGFKKTDEQKMQCYLRSIKPQTKETIEKRKATCLEKYGVEFPSQNADIAKKTKETFLSKYGVTSAFASNDMRKKWAKEYQDRYGVDHPMKRDEVKQKMRDTNMERYGVENYSSLISHRCNMRILNKNNDERCDKTLLLSITSDRESFRNFVLEHGFTTTQEIADFLHYTICSVEKMLHCFDSWDLMHHYKSYQENELKRFLTDLNIYSVSDRSIIAPEEIDLFCPDYNIGIEFNGTYWHSNLFKGKHYHENKSLLAQKKGIRLIHIYEYEWEDPIKREIIKSLLRIAFNKVENRIYARNCEVREITNEEAKPFNDANHLQGHRNAQVTYGLFHNNELVQLMSFSKHKKYEWEIIRGCPGSNNLVVGGVSKLFTHFLREYNPNQVFSYCDFNKFDGVGYEKLGMKFIGYTGPDMKWIINGNVFNRNPNKHKLYKENADSQIWGSGSKKYLWKRAGE